MLLLLLSLLVSWSSLAQPTIVAADPVGSVVPAQTDGQWTAASAAPSLYRATDGGAPRLHLGVMSVPLWGHFKPLWAIAEELAYRGHTVSVFVEEPSWCATLLQHSQHTAPFLISNLSVGVYERNTAAADGMLDIYCLIVPRHREVFSTATFQPMTREGSSATLSFVGLFNDLFRHHELSLGDYLHTVRVVHEHHRPLTTILCDIVTYACASTARKLNLPVVHSFPFTTQLSVGLHPLLPAVGLGLPRRMTLLQRTQNFAFKLLSLAAARGIVRTLNHVRAAHGVAPFSDVYDVAGMYAPIISPTLWGLDIPQPLCPNVHPVGPLNTRDQRLPYRRHDLPAQLTHFLDRCTQGVVYVNWGTLSAPTDAMENTLFSGLMAASPYCVVWKRRSAPLVDHTSPPADRFFITSWLSSPMAVLRHPHTLAFISHCGDSSVLEAVEAAVPIIGVPLFADQVDVCQRVVESGIGVQVTQTKSFTPADVVQAVTRVVDMREKMARRLQDLRAIATAHGGPSRAADIVETRQFNLLLDHPARLEQCRHLDSSLRIDNMLIVWGGSVLLMTLLWFGLLRFVCRRVLCLSLPLMRVAKASLRTTRHGRAAPVRHRVRAVPLPYKAHKSL
jgi:UDP:flavonoid glycosyltransferase YjiC (YdhE family)